MSTFRYAILGAAKIAAKFCQAASLVKDCQVCAVASKSLERAKGFAGKNGIPKAYGSYEELLDREKPDCAYIAVTANDHYRLAMMCVERGVPVLCEKAMFQNSAEAESLFAQAKERGVFVMEAMWSRFLPTTKRVKQWLAQDRIGIPEISKLSIGFIAPEGADNRYFNPGLGGGAARDITVYAYEITTYVLEQEIRKMEVSAVRGDTGVDISNHISIEFQHTLADLATSFVANMDSGMALYGRKGKIIWPNPHFSAECFLYDQDGTLVEHFVDKETENGFTYELEETIRCIGQGLLESPVVPWKDTLECARLFDRIDGCCAER